MTINNSTPAPQTDIKSLQEENELLLFQLNQVQEEMEHYFLLNQTNERQVAELKLRLETANRAKHGNNPFYKLTDLLGITMQEKIATISSSGFFDRAWYLDQYPDIAKNGMDPARHYLLYGAKEGRNPGPHFDTCWYLDTYPDVAKDGMNPLLHYERYGKNQGHEPRIGGVQIPDVFAEERKWLQLAKDEAAKLAENRQKQIEQLTRERDEQAHWHKEHANWANALVVEKEELVTRLNGLQADLTRQQEMQLELAEERDEQKFLADARRGEIQYLNEALMAETTQCEGLRKKLEQLTHERSEFATLQHLLEEEVKSLAGAREEQLRLAQERQEEFERLLKIKSELEVEHLALKQSTSALVQERDEQKFIADSRRVEIQQLNDGLSIASVRCAELQQQLEQVVQDRSALTGQLRALENEVLALKQSEVVLTQDRDEQRFLADSRRGEMQNLDGALKIELARCEELQHQLQRFAEEKSTLTEQHQILEKEVAALKQSVLGLTQERDEKSILENSQQGEIQSLSEALKIEAARGEELQRQLEQFVQERSALTRQNQGLESEVAELKRSVVGLTQDRDEQAHWHQENANWAKLLVSEKDALERVLAGMQNEVSGLKQMQSMLEQEKSTLIMRRDEQTALITQLQSELQENRQAASLSLKLQMLREADLKELQGRYQALRQKEEHQHRLLTDLGERLRTASAYFHQIANNESLPLSTQTVRTTKKRVVKAKS